MAEQEELIFHLAGDISELEKKHLFLLVHGGGCEVSRLSKELGYEPVFREGIRITSEEEMNIVEMVLSGKVNKRLVRIFQSCGLDAVGLCGADGRAFTGAGLDAHASTRTGEIRRVNTTLFKILLENGFFPIVSSSSMDEAGLGLNINADSVAFEIACSLGSSSLLFLSDIPGIMKEGKILKYLGEAEAREEIKRGTISGGMIPKVSSALKALERGVGQIIIGQYQSRGSLNTLLNGSRGTRISLRS